MVFYISIFLVYLVPTYYFDLMLQIICHFCGLLYLHFSSVHSTLPTFYFDLMLRITCHFCGFLDRRLWHTQQLVRLMSDLILQANCVRSRCVVFVCVVALLRSRDGAIAFGEWRHRGPCVCGDRRCRPCGIRFVFGARTSRCSGGAVFRCLHCTWPPGSAARTWYQLYHRSEFCCCRRFHNSAFFSCIFFRRILQLRRQNILEEFEKSSEICFFLLV